MPFRANVTRRANWTRQTLWIFEGTYLELHPEYGSDYWFVVDGRKPDRKLAGPCTINHAKVVAERLVEQKPELRKPEGSL